MRRATFFLLAAMAAAALPATAQTPRQIRVDVQFRQTGTQSRDGSGTIEFTEATTDVIVPNGRAVILAGSTTDTHQITRQILGIAREQSMSETTVVLTATAR